MTSYQPGGRNYQLQYIVNDGDSVRILQILWQVGPQMLTQDQKEGCMQIFQDLLNQ